MTTPMYEQIKTDLRRRIVEEGYAPGSPFFTQRAICDRYGVSMLTAARALNELVGEGLLVRRQGKGTFVADRSSSSTEARQAPIHCIVPSLVGQHVAEFVRGVESTCVESGYTMSFSDSRWSPERQAKALAGAAESGVAAVVLYPVEGDTDTTSSLLLAQHRIPLVFADRYWPEVAADAVLVDDFDLGYQLTKRLIQLGHRRIATLWAETECTSVRHRLLGHLQALRESGIPELVEFTRLQHYWPSSQQTRMELLQRILHPDLAPTVLLCCNGFVLWAVANDLARLQINVPVDIELSGMDESGPYEQLPITCASARVPSFRLGEQAATMAIARIDGQTVAPQRTTLPIEIVEHSTADAYLRVESTPPRPPAVRTAPA